MAVRSAPAGAAEAPASGAEGEGSGRRHPLGAGLTLVPGSLGLILLRLALALAAGLPVAAASWLGLQQAARQPYFTSVEGPLPLYHLGRLAEQLPGALLPCLLAGVILAVLAHQLLLGGALCWLSGEPRARGGLLRAVLVQGWAQLGRLLRVLALALLLDLAGLALLRAALQQLQRAGEASGWTALTLELQLPALFALLGFCWLLAVGAWGFACRLILVADQRRLVRSAALLALSFLKRKPFSLFGFFVLVTVLLEALGAGALLCWRQGPPQSGAGVAGWIGLSLFLAVLQAVGWHWLLRAGLLVYGDRRLEELRQAPDAPWGWGQILARCLGRRWGRPDL